MDAFEHLFVHFFPLLDFGYDLVEVYRNHPLVIQHSLLIDFLFESEKAGQDLAFLFVDASTEVLLVLEIAIRLENGLDGYFL